MLVVLAHEEPHLVAVPKNVALDKLTVGTAVAHRSVDPLWHLNLVRATPNPTHDPLKPLKAYKTDEKYDISLPDSFEII
jgi:hypothetical protein